MAAAQRLPRGVWPKRGLEAVSLCVILGLAAALRFGWPGVRQFDFDQAQVSLAALRTARLGQPATVGMISSAGLPNFPGAAWVYALPFALSADPLIASLFTGLLNVLAVLGAWWLARRAWGPWAGFVAGLLLAASPYAVFFSRDIWAQDLLIPLAILWACAAVVGASTGRGWALALCVAAAGFAPQVHYAGAALLLPTLYLAVRAGWWRRWRPMLAGWLAAGWLAAPFVYTVWCCRPDILGQFQAAGGGWQIASLSLRHLAEAGLGLNWEWYLLGPQGAGATGLTGALRLTQGALAVGIAAGLALLIRDDWRQRGAGPDEARAATMLVPAWALAAPLLFLASSGPVHLHYQLASLPALCLAVGALAGRPAGRVVVVILALGVAGVQAAAMARALDLAGREAWPGGLGTPLEWPRAAARAVRDGRPVVVHAAGDEAETVGEVAGFDVLLWDYPHQIVDGRSVLLAPAGGGRLLATFPDLPAVDEAASAGLVLDRVDLPRRAGDPPYVALLLSGGAPRGFETATPVRLANGAELRGWRAGEVGGRLRVATLWEIVGPIESGDYHVFNHLRTLEAADPVAIQDAPASSPAWRAGDRVIVWADFDRPEGAGPFFVDVGMYSWPDIARVPALDHAGDPLAPIRLGPLTPP